MLSRAVCVSRSVRLRARFANSDSPPKKSGKNYVFSHETVTAENFRAFVKSYVDGTLTPNLKSEPVPEKNDGPVKTIVGTTFSDIVMDNTKDVLVEFYAP
jgi:protein disulfide-isomerase A1